MKRILLLAALCLFSGTAHATTYNVDIFGPLPDGVTAGPQAIAMTNACGGTICAGGFPPAYSFYAQPGDVLDFGTLSIGTLSFGDGRHPQPFQYIDANGNLVSTSGIITNLFRGTYAMSDHYFPVLALQLNELIYSCNSANPVCSTNLFAQATLTPRIEADLTFTIGSTGFIELGWVAGTYTAPASIGAVPEPSTWIMMLLGFAGLVIVRNERQPLRRVWRLGHWFKNAPGIA